MAIFSYIERILYNHFATFHCSLGFLKFLTFSWRSLRKYEASLPDGIIGSIIELTKGGISSNWSNSSSMAFLTLIIHRCLGLATLSIFFCVWNIEQLSNVFCSHKRLRHISLMVKVNAIELLLFFYNTLDCINPVTTKNRNLETMKVKLSYILYLTIVHAFVLVHCWQS
jgi:hypothetical protein